MGLGLGTETSTHLHTPAQALMSGACGPHDSGHIMLSTATNDATDTMMSQVQQGARLLDAPECSSLLHLHPSEQGAALGTQHHSQHSAACIQSRTKREGAGP